MSKLRDELEKKAKESESLKESVSDKDFIEPGRQNNSDINCN